MDDDGPPPLEEMIDQLNFQASLTGKPAFRASPAAPSTAPAPAPPATPSTAPASAPASTAESEAKPQPATKATPAASSSSSSKPFGFKKGFLLSGSSAKASTTSTAAKPSPPAVPATTEEAIPVIRAKPDAQKPGVLPEVQTRLQEAEDFVNRTSAFFEPASWLFLRSHNCSLPGSQWLNEDLLTKLQSKPHLLKRFADPTFMAAIGEFQTNPQQAMHKYKDSAEIVSFMQEISSVLGDHFAALGSTPTPPSSSSSSTTITARGAGNAAPAAEPDVEAILSRPQVRETMQDPEVVAFIQRLRQARTVAEQKQLTQEAAGRPSLIPKLRILVNAGLLQMQID
eukprot:m.350293 g.350293  ORF g.350293 m.350293 type:complete len:341 (-) comp55898_c0_seq3:24-1046(-)